MHGATIKISYILLISNFRRVFNIVCVLLGISPASDCDLPTFRNPLSVPSSKAGCRVFYVGKSQSDAGEIPKRTHTYNHTYCLLLQEYYLFLTT
jgi:hypothetical protein